MLAGVRASRDAPAADAETVARGNAEKRAEVLTHLRQCGLLEEAKEAARRGDLIEGSRQASYVSAMELADHIFEQGGTWNVYSRLRPFARTLEPKIASARLIIAAAEYAAAAGRSVESVLRDGPRVPPDTGVFEEYLSLYGTPGRQ